MERAKMLGGIFYLVGALGLIYAIIEAPIDFTDSFGSAVLLLIWCILTMGLGWALMNGGGKSNNEKDDN